MASTVVLKRKLAEATQVVVRSPQPTMEQLAGVGEALADLFEDLTGMACNVKIVGREKKP